MGRLRNEIGPNQNSKIVVGGGYTLRGVYFDVNKKVFGINR